MNLVSSLWSRNNTLNKLYTNFFWKNSHTNIINKNSSLNWLTKINLSHKNKNGLNGEIDKNFNNFVENFFYVNKNISLISISYKHLNSPSYNTNIILKKNTLSILELHQKNTKKLKNNKLVKFVTWNYTKEGTKRFLISSYIPANPALLYFFPIKTNRSFKRKNNRIRYINSKMSKYLSFSIKNMINIGIKKIINLSFEKNFSKIRHNLFYLKKQEKKYIRSRGIRTGFPLKNNSKRSTYYFTSKTYRCGKYRDLIQLSQFTKHPAAQLMQIKKNLMYGIGLNFGYSIDIRKQTKDIYAKLYRMSWKYFKFKIEKFFYSQLAVRVHVWFLNIWDIFLNGVDSLWKWHRYESKTVYQLTKKGRRFFIDSRENAKFYVRTMTLTLTVVGGVKLFFDKISVLMRKYRNNWAFIVSTTQSLRFCINFFWFRFFINYKITLQGKIGGFLRAQKKIFKKGNITIENKSCAITYYRGYPVTKFGAYNLSFWLQYRIPNLIEKFEDLEYIDTMKILLSMYSVPWLASRLSEIIREILRNRVAMIRRKVEQYERRKYARKVLLVSILKKAKYSLKLYDNNLKRNKTYNKVKALIKLSKIKKKIKKKTIKKSWLASKKY